MANRRCSYVIVTSLPTAGLPRGRRWRHPAGRHRLGTPGTIRRYPAGPPRRRRPHHRRGPRPAAFLARFASVLLLLGTLLASGWFTVSGATAFAQMIQP